MEERVGGACQLNASSRAQFDKGCIAVHRGSSANAQQIVRGVATPFFSCNRFPFNVKQVIHSQMTHICSIEFNTASSCDIYKAHTSSNT